MLVCPECFATPGLARRIVDMRPQYPNQRCDFHPSRKGVPLEPVTEIVDTVFRENYTFGVPDDRYGDATGDDLETVLYELIGTEEPLIVSTIMSDLIDNDPYWPQDGEGPFYSEDYGYVADRRSLGRHGRLWEIFRRGLLHEGRFFNTEAEARIEAIFEDVQHQRDVHGQGPIYMVRPGETLSTFYRARIADDPALRKAITSQTAENLGPPPERLRRPGRLNPSGIAAFYGAFDLATCVAELRPAVGSLVMAAKFAITEPICVLDTTRFSAAPKADDPFTNNALERAAQWRFMRSFMHEIAQPISPSDEHLDYVTTQAVAEYLNRRHRFTFEGQSRSIDAILYRSAQHQEGLNIALLGPAAIVGAAAGAAQDSPSESKGSYSLFGLAFEAPLPPTARIAPVAGSLETHRVTSALYPTEHLGDGEAWDHEFY